MATPRVRKIQIFGPTGRLNRAEVRKVMRQLREEREAAEAARAANGGGAAPVARHPDGAADAREE